jgi:type II secretory pathway component PulC
VPPICPFPVELMQVRIIITISLSLSSVVLVAVAWRVESRHVMERCNGLKVRSVQKKRLVLVQSGLGGGIFLRE